MVDFIPGPYNAGNLNQFKQVPPAARLGEDFVLESGNTYDKIRTRCKSLVRNNWAAHAAVDTMVDYLCCNGGLTPIGGTDRANEIWAKWVRGPVDVGDSQTWLEVSASIVAGACEGDVGIHITYNPDLIKSGEVSTRISVVDGAAISTPQDFKGNGKNPITGNFVRLGIEYDRQGREVAYWVRKDYTADKFSNTSEYYRRIPRKDKAGNLIFTLFRNQNRRMVMQGRGLPIFSSATPEVEDLADLASSSIKRAETVSNMGVIVRTAAPKKVAQGLGGVSSAGTANTGLTQEGKLTKIGQLTSGAVTLLPIDDGEINTITHTGNIDLVALMDNSKRDYSAGVGIPKEILTSNFTGINFSSGKLSFDKLFRKLDRWERALGLVFTHIRKAVVTEGLLLNGVIPTPEDLEVTAWIGAPRPDPNPAQTAGAEESQLKNGTNFRSLIIANRLGIGYEEALKIRSKELSLEEKYSKNGADVSAPLNGAQVTSLVEIISAAGAGTIPAESAKSMIRAAFPSISEDAVNAMIEPITAKQAEEPEEVDNENGNDQD